MGQRGHAQQDRRRTPPRRRDPICVDCPRPSKKKIEPIIKQEDPVIEVDEPEEQVEEVEPKPLSSNGWNYNKPLSASKIKEFKEREKQEIRKLEAIAAEARAEEEKPKGLKLSDIVKQQEENKKLMQEQLASRNDIQDGFDPAEVEGYEEFNKKYEPVQDKADYEEELKQIKETADEITKTAQENTELHRC